MPQNYTFDSDIFISYAHFDNEPYMQIKWVTHFHDALKIRIKQVVGKQLEVWFDEHGLQGNTDFNPEIEERIKKLRMMVSILSPRYVLSDSCKREMALFYDATTNNGGFTLNNQSRIFKVVKTPFDRTVINTFDNNNLKMIFNDILDYEFYIKESDEHFAELYPEGPRTFDFLEKLEDVVQNIAKLYKQFNSNTITEEKATKIYLASTSNDLRGYRDNLVRELEAAGYSIMPDKQLPEVLDEFNKVVEASLDECILSVHLISATNYATVPEGADDSTVVLQNKLAAKKSEKKGLNRLIWVPATTLDAPKNIKQEQFINDLINAKDNMQLGADLMKGTLEEFKDAIITKARKIEADEKANEEALKNAAAQPAATATNNKIKKVYLIHSEPDSNNIDALIKLIKKNGHSVLLPNFDRLPEVLQQEHNENLNLCDAVIIYYGAGNERWVMKMEGDLLRLTRVPEKPVLDKIILLAEPVDDDKNQYISNDIQIINGQGEFDSTILNSFFQKLNA